MARKRKGGSEIAAAQMREVVLDAWRTNAAVTAFLVARLPDALWDAKLPGAPARTGRNGEERDMGVPGRAARCSAT
jgi:hypothetical protein